MAIRVQLDEFEVLIYRFPFARFALSAESGQYEHCTTLGQVHVSHAGLPVLWYLCPSLTPFCVNNPFFTTTDLALMDYFKGTPDYRHNQYSFVGTDFIVRPKKRFVNKFTMVT